MPQNLYFGITLTLPKHKVQAGRDAYSLVIQRGGNFDEAYAAFSKLPR